MKNKFLIILFIGLFAMHKSYAQSTYISALPLEYNPSFAGSGGNARMATSIYAETHKDYLNSDNFRIKTNSTSVISYDQFFSKLHMGLGLTLNYSNNNPYEFSSRIKNMEKLAGSIAISPKFSFQGKYTLAPSLQGILGNNENLYFQTHHSGNFLKIKAGLLFNVKNFYIGYTFDLLNKSFGETKYTYSQKLDSLYNVTIFPNGIYKTPFNSNIQVGYTFQKKTPSKFSFTPQLIIYLRNTNNRYYSSTNDGAIGQGFGVLNKITNNTVLNLNFKFNRILLGNFIGNDRLGLMIGYQNKNLKIAYTQYKSIGRLGNNIGYGGQLSLRYTFNSKSDNRLPLTNY